MLSAVSLITGFSAGPANAEVITMWSGLSSTNVQVSFEAHMTISGNNLSIVLINNSPVSSLNPNDTLGSFYFDAICGGVRPALSYNTAVGAVWWADANAPDTLINPAGNLKATAAGDNTWQFRTMNPGLSPFMGYGIGTVGNNGLSPNNFMGNIVDGRDYSIYKGEITTNNLDMNNLVKEQATFTFTGVSGCTEADISLVSAFGMGTAPDSIEFSPEPATLGLLLGVGLFGFRRPRTR